MTSRDFCYWLQGIFEVANPRELGPEATAKIRSHLAMVFIHEIDPEMGDKKHQEKLDEAHGDGVLGPGGQAFRC